MECGHGNGKKNKKPGKIMPHLQCGGGMWLLCQALESGDPVVRQF